MDSGDTAWMLTSTAFVMFMTLPGLAMVYAGLVQSKSVLSVVMQCFSITAVLLFSLAWSLLVYMPICHWVWGGGWLAQLGVMDFACGLALHANVGATALVAAVMVGRRLSFPNRLMPPHNPGMTAVGTGMVWVGAGSDSTEERVRGQW